MDKLNKITKIKVSLLLFYLLTLFTPIYSDVIMGTRFKVSISELGAGTFFVVFFLLLIFATILSRFLLENYYKYMYLVTIGFMSILFLMLLFFKDSSTLRLSWYFQFVLISLLFLSHFMEEFTIKIFDILVSKTKICITNFNAFLRKKIQDRKDKKSQPEILVIDDENNKGVVKEDIL